MPCGPHAPLSEKQAHGPGQAEPCGVAQPAAMGQGRVGRGHGHTATPCPHAFTPSLPGPTQPHSRSQGPAHPTTRSVPAIPHSPGPCLPMTRALPRSLQAPAPCPARYPSPGPCRSHPALVPPPCHPGVPGADRSRCRSHVSGPEAAARTCPGQSRRRHAPCFPIGCIQL